MEKLVTIVIPVYNVEKYLDKCVSSVVNQTYKNLEIILVDDGSPDNCPQMCEDWAQKDSRIKVIHKENAGLGMARNTGIDNANGEYICFFDSDDYIDEKLVEKCVGSLDSNNADVVWYGMADFYEDGRVCGFDNNAFVKKYTSNHSVVNELLPELISHDYGENFTHGYAFSAWSGMFSLSLINKYGLRFCSEREIISEDTYFLLQLFSKANVVLLIEDILYFRFRNSTSLTTIYRADRQDKNNYFLSEAVKLIQSSGYPDEILTRIYMLYHSFTIAALKMVVCSELSLKSKCSKVAQILSNELLQSTLTKTVLQKEKKSLKYFFLLARHKMYFLCYLILKAKRD